MEGNRPGCVCESPPGGLEVKVFWDTNLFIYLWEQSSRSEEMRALTAFMQSGGNTRITSTVTAA